MPGFEHGREELRTPESLEQDQGGPIPGPDGDSRPLHEPMEDALASELDEQRGLKIEQRLRDQDRAS